MPPRHHTTNAPHDTAPHVHVRDKQNTLRDREGGRVSNQHTRASRHTRASQRSRHSAFALDSLGKPLAKHGQLLYSSLATPLTPHCVRWSPSLDRARREGARLGGLASRLPDLARISSSLVGKSVTSHTGCPEAAGYALEGDATTAPHHSAARDARARSAPRQRVACVHSNTRHGCRSRPKLRPPAHSPRSSALSALVLLKVKILVVTLVHLGEQVRLDRHALPLAGQHLQLLGVEGVALEVVEGRRAHQG